MDEYDYNASKEQKKGKGSFNTVLEADCVNRMAFVGAQRIATAQKPSAPACHRSSNTQEKSMGIVGNLA